MNKPKRDVKIFYDGSLTSSTKDLIKSKEYKKTKKAVKEAIERQKKEFYHLCR